MLPRTRKLIGTIVLLAFLACYSLLVAALAPAFHGSGKLWEPLFYVVAGILWVLPAGALISWMHRSGG